MNTFDDIGRRDRISIGKVIEGGGPLAAAFKSGRWKPVEAALVADLLAKTGDLLALMESGGDARDAYIKLKISHEQATGKT